MTQNITKNVSAEDRLIISLDMPVLQSKELINQIGDLVRVVKINYLHFLEVTTSTNTQVTDFLSFLADKNIDVFFDLKFHDIPNTVGSYIKALSNITNIGFCTIHAGDLLIKAALQGKNNKPKPKILVVTLLTSLDEHDLKDIYGIEGSHSIADHVVHRAKQAYEHGVDGVVASGKHAGLIKQAIGLNKNFVVVSPGIRLHGDTDDHKQVASPDEAIENGSDYLVIGRPIYNSDDPRQTTMEIIDQMQKAFDRKLSRGV